METRARSKEGDTSVKVLPVIPSDSSSRGLIEAGAIAHGLYRGGFIPACDACEWLFVPKFPNTVPRGFLAYASTAHGQTVFKNFDVLPITQPIKLVPSK